MKEIQGKFKINGKTITYPSQKELADGWELAKSKKLFIKKVNKETSEVNTFKLCFYNEVTLDKLPPKIWNRVGRFSMYNSVFCDDFYKFKVKPTDDDNDIIMLHHMIHKKMLNKEKIKELYNSLTNKGFNGWVLIKANMCLKLFL